MKNILSILLTVIAVFFLHGCAGTIEVSSEYDTARSFGHIQTFDWLSRLQQEPEEQDRDNPFIKQRLKKAIEENLAGKGITRRESGDVDVYIEFYAKTKKDAHISTVMPVTSITSGYSYDPLSYTYPRYRSDSYRYFGPVYETTITYGAPEKVTDYISIGSLVIDMIDPASNELIWRSVAEAQIDQWDQATRNDKAVKAVGKIMRHFPPENK